MKIDRLSRDFWRFNAVGKIGSTGIAFYFFLLERYRKTGNGFKLADREIIETLGISNNTVKPLKQKLQKLGLIKFETREKTSRTAATVYEIVLDYKFSPKELNKRIEKPSPPKEILPVENQPVSTEKEGFPTFEEFLDFARTNSLYKAEFDLKIKKEYEKYCAKGWKTPDGTAIDWKRNTGELLFRATADKANERVISLRFRQKQ